MGPALLLDYKLPDVFTPELAGKVLTVMATMRKNWEATIAICAFIAVQPAIG
jgi:hypothetical protein